MFAASSVIRPTQRNSHNSVSKPSKHQPKRRQSAFLSTVPDSLMGGVLIVAESGEVVYTNPKARQLCRHLSGTSASSNAIPEVVWQLCQSLIDSQDLFPDRNLILESEVPLNHSQLRLRVRYFEFDGDEHLCLLVTLDERFSH